MRPDTPVSVRSWCDQIDDLTKRVAAASARLYKPSTRAGAGDGWSSRIATSPPWTCLTCFEGNADIRDRCSHCGRERTARRGTL